MNYQESMWEAIKRGYAQIPKGIRILVTINVIVFVFQTLLPGSWNSALLNVAALSPRALENVLEPWRLISYQFMPANFFHLLFNMLWLWWMGRAVEEAIGSDRLLVLFIGSGIGGGLVHAVAASLFESGITVGASGSVFGVMVAFAFLFPTMPIMLFLLPPIEARFVVLILILMDVLFLGANDNSARIVHLGGAATGWFLFTSGFYSINVVGWFRELFKNAGPSSRKSRMNLRIVEEATIVEEIDQSTIDHILDKIAQKGYDSLTEKEKKLLLELAKKK